MRVFTTVPQQDLKRVAAAAQAAEADGYDGIISMENKHDPFLALAVAGAASETIELHTGVAIAFARTPMAAAQIGWDLAGATGWRFVLGLGSGGYGPGFWASVGLGNRPIAAMRLEFSSCFTACQPIANERSKLISDNGPVTSTPLSSAYSMSIGFSLQAALRKASPGTNMITKSAEPSVV